MSPLEQLAALAPTLKEAELRVLLYLSARALADGGVVVSASSREIAAEAKVARSSTVQALDALAARSLIAVRQGTPRKPAVYQVNALLTESISGPVNGPLSRARGPVPGPLPGLFADLRGPASGPPPTENTGLTASTARVDIDSSITLAGIFDRLHKARKEHFNPEVFTVARRFLHGYLAKLGTREILANGVPHPPDDKIVTDFLTLGTGVGGWPRLEALLYELMAERKEAYSYGWFITLALQRIHGIQPQAVKQHREKLKLLKAVGGGSSARSGEMISAGELLKRKGGGL